MLSEGTITIQGALGLVGIGVFITWACMHVWHKMEINAILRRKFNFPNSPVLQTDCKDTLREIQIFLSERVSLARKGGIDGALPDIDKVFKHRLEFCYPGKYSPILLEFIWFCHVLGCEVVVRQIKNHNMEKEKSRGNKEYISKPRKFFRYFVIIAICIFAYSDYGKWVIREHIVPVVLTELKVIRDEIEKVRMLFTHLLS